MTDRTRVTQTVILAAGSGSRLATTAIRPSGDTRGLRIDEPRGSTMVRTVLPARSISAKPVSAPDATFAGMTSVPFVAMVGWRAPDATRKGSPVARRSEKETGRAQTPDRCSNSTYPADEGTG